MGIKRKNIKEFIDDVVKIHGNKYEYSKVIYKNNYSKIIILCPIHGIFKQTPSNHLNGRGCPNCGGNGKLSNVDFIKRVNKIHNNKYNYSLTKYNGYNNSIDIICPIHGEFQQKGRNHIKGFGCKKCAYDNKRIGVENFIERSKKIHVDKYSYELVEYKNNNTKVNIICSKHGEFLQTPANHLKGQNCPNCYESKGEKRINDFLIKNKIEFEKQKKFNECKNIFKLPFDFYLPKQNILIEYDGEQHFNAYDHFGGIKKLINCLKNDEIKNNFTKNNDIMLIRIPYYNYNNIENILNKTL